MTYDLTSQHPSSLVEDNTRAFNRSYQRVLNTVTDAIKKQFHLCHHTAEEVAATGVTYASRLFLNPSRAIPFSEKNLTGLAMWKASNAAKDWLRHEQSRPDTVFFDNYLSYEDGEDFPESPILNRYSLQRTEEQENDKKGQELGRAAYRHLEDMFDLLRLSPLHRDVFRSIYLEKRPVTEVCARLRITADYAYVIIHKVRTGLHRIGPGYLRAA